MRPLVLAPNLMRRPYRGGPALATFRGMAEPPGERCPEDWIASTTTVFGQDALGLTALPDGRTLADAVAHEPEVFLGPEHRSVFGTSTGLLLKLIDAQQRLSVHIHPDRDFSRRHLGAVYGKTEAWYVVSTTHLDAVMHFGFTEDIDEDELLDVVESERGASLLDRMHRVPVRAGDSMFVPAGTPHAIGEGILLVEAQEPSDLLVRLEWGGYVVGAMPSELGLGFGTALQAVDRTAWGDERLAGLRPDPSADSPTAGGEGGGGGEGEGGSWRSVLPGAADSFFRLDHGRVKGSETLTAAADFAVLVVLDGSGTLTAGEQPAMDIHRGQAILVPHAAGVTEVRGDLDVLRARPSAPAAVRESDPDLTRLLHDAGNPQDKSPTNTPEKRTP